MEESILYPSPNWFLPSILRVSADGWLVYGGPGKTLIVLEPLPPVFEGVLDGNHRYKTHVVNQSHKERVVTVDTSPEWPEKRHFVSGGSDGKVKEWTIKEVDNEWAIKNTHSHEAHAIEKEDVVSVGYSMSTHVISVGSFSNIVLWELNTNTTRTFNSFLRNFKATCMSCSPHMPLVVAVGTKQGVVFVLDLNGIKGHILYKVRGQDDEIAQVAWCPQYEVIVKRSLTDIKKSAATKRLENIRNEPEPTKPDASGIEKTLPDDSFDESLVVPEDDMFDIYKDHEPDEFGHKKYEPEYVVVKNKDDENKEDFLAECLKLKDKILKNKEEDTIENLVAAMDKTNFEGPSGSKSSEDRGKTVTGVASLGESASKLVSDDSSAHIHRHLLACISKNGYNVRIWSKTGKIVASCVILIQSKNSNNKTFISKAPNMASLCWYKPNSLLMTDGKMTMVECNPLQIDCRNKLHWKIVHSSHRRGLYYITSNAARVQTPDTASDPHYEDQWSVWTAAQDRYIVKYDMKTRTVLAKFGTCGGHLYNIAPCPYDAGKLAVGVGDGAVRVWECRTTGEDDAKLTIGEVNCFWQNVQGKILQCVWHPTKENLLAFSTAECRVGLLDISKSDRPATVLPTALSHGVYSLGWGLDMTLFAAGGNEMMMYQANKPDKAPIPIHIVIEGQKWEPTVVNYSSRGLTVASYTGGVALFSGPGGQALAAKFVCTRMVQAIEWHPQQTSSSDEESEYKNLLAISSLARSNTIIVLKLEDKEGGGKQFSDFTILAGHSDGVLQLTWSPHRDGQLLSTSQDKTVRVWDAIHGVCISIFDGHACSSVAAAWCAQPQLADKVMSGGNDYCLRLWDINCYPAENYKEVKREAKKRKSKKIRQAQVPDDNKNAEGGAEPVEIENLTEINAEVEDTQQMAVVKNIGAKVKDAKVSKKFVMPIIGNKLCRISVDGIQIINALHKYFAENKKIKTILEIYEDNADIYDLECFKLFGTINDVNEILDMECQAHLQVRAYKEYMMLNILRGHIDAVIKFANEKDLLDPFLLSIAPCVSFKYWKDVAQLYIAQLDRLAVTKPPSEYHTGNFDYGGRILHKVAVFLSVHDVKSAVDVLQEAKLFKEAYVLCRCRHMDSIAEETLHNWANESARNGILSFTALLYIQMGKIKLAASVLRRSTQQEYLNLAAELAKLAGLNTFADFMETKVKSVEKESNKTVDQIEETLAELPTRMELFIKKNEARNGESEVEKQIVEDQIELEELPAKMELLMKVDKDQNGELEIVKRIEDLKVFKTPLTEKELAKGNLNQNGSSNSEVVIDSEV